MLFWLVLHSLQLSGAEAAEPGFSGRKVDTKLLNQIKSKCDEILRGAFLCQMTGNHRRRKGEGTHQAARRVPGAAPLLVAPGTLMGVWWPPSVPPFAYKT